MVDISIIIVNYNVKHFLKQCLQSIQKSEHDLNIETIVIDNQSLDGSPFLIKQEFPEVTLIENENNVGFSKANNQGIAIAKGKYILLLNPDTILNEDCLAACFLFSESQKKLGALGVKLLDGKGVFLPESKRGFPSPWTSITKLTGIWKIFPRSKFFNPYYLGHLPNDKTSEIDVLCGAFMFMPKVVLDEVGYLDEAFFMYGEDIDLSFRIQKGGFKVFYFPETQIIHFKGESTKKASFNYVKTFYGAMKIFAEKHTKGKLAFFNVALLNLAIFLFGFISLLKAKIGKLVPFVFDFVIGSGIVLGVSRAWGYLFFKSTRYFVDQLFSYYVFGIVFLLMMLLFIIGHYDADAKKRRFIMMSFMSLLLMLAIYGLMPVDLRFSRIVITISTILLLFVFFNTRKLWNKLRYGNFTYEKDSFKRILIVGSQNSAHSLIKILEEKYTNSKILGTVSPSQETVGSFYLNNITKLKELVTLNKANEVIFCTKDLESSAIFSSMASIGSGYSFKLANTTNDALVGSTNKNSSGDWFTEDVQFSIDMNSSRRIKRLFDIVCSLIVIVTFPLFLLYSTKSRMMVFNVLSVFVGSKTWIGYLPHGNILPLLKPAVFPVLDLYRFDIKFTENKELINFHYAKNYSVIMDFEMCTNYAFR